MKFKIPVTWSVYGTYDVEANSLKEAMNKVDEAEPPYDHLPKGDYIDDSMTIDVETAKEMNDLLSPE